MNRFGMRSTIASLTMFVVAACAPKDNKPADTTAAVVDTSAATSTPAASTTASSASSTTTAAAIVPININTATDAQILAIPGMGPRMLREFKEYRPYTSIAQFRREIGKYVDKAEVARLEQYIVIK
jgi:DNA uptake protein ComE-like DNA-binding protein